MFVHRLGCVLLAQWTLYTLIYMHVNRISLEIHVTMLALLFIYYSRRRLKFLFPFLCFYFISVSSTASKNIAKKVNHNLIPCFHFFHRNTTLLGEYTIKWNWKHTLCLFEWFCHILLPFPNQNKSNMLFVVVGIFEVEFRFDYFFHSIKIFGKL